MIDRQVLRDYCGSKPGAVEDFPFDAETLVFKVMGKLFALMGLDIPDDQPQTINLKCDPAWAEVLRQTYPAVQPGYHMNKRHWNTVTCDGTIPDSEIYEMIDQSYALVVKGLKKVDREKLMGMDQKDE